VFNSPPRILPTSLYSTVQYCTVGPHPSNLVFHPHATMTALRNLPALVRKQFKSAQESGDLTFYPTRVSILPCEGLPVHIRHRCNNPASCS
jgi:hypothetical protein